MIKQVFQGLFIVFGLTACSEQSSSGDHVWQEQADAIKRAEQVEQDLIQAVEQQQQAIEAQTE